ncbi:MAG: ATP-binding protein [Planctomycetota bacterium]
MRDVLLSTLVASKVPVAIFGWRNEPGWPVEFVSENVDVVLGYAQEDFLSGRVVYAQIIHPDDLERVTQEVVTHSATRATEFEHEDYRVVDPVGAVRWVQDLTAILYDEGQITHYVGYILDITARREAEDSLRAAKAEVEALLERTRELERLKSQAFTNVSHELKTPLTLILGPVERLLAGDQLTVAQRAGLEVVRRNARTLQAHVDDLLDVSRHEAGGAGLRYERADAAALLRLAASHFDGLAAGRGVAYAVEAVGPLEAELDAPKVQRVLLNLLSNAFRHTPTGGRVRASLSRLPGAEGGEARLRIEVADSGPGIAPADREVVFERFRQLESGARRAGGTGLGLTIAREFVRLHGGELTVEDAPEGGARFVVELPLRAPAGTTLAPAAPQPAASLAPAELATPALAAPELAAPELAAPELAAPELEERGSAREPGRPLVLVVEDNPEMRAFLAEGLGALGEVVCAPDGRAGLALARERRPALVITDLMMPEMSGEELLGALRADPALARVPALVLTARDEAELRERLLDAGAQDFLSKPFSTRELRARAKNLLELELARRVLQRDLDSREADLGALADAMAARQRELRETVEALRAASKQAEQVSALKSQFLHMVSHELRTPLTALNLQLERLQRPGTGELNEKQRELARRLGVSGGRLAHLIDSLLEYARIESGRLSLERGRVELPALCREVLDQLRPHAEAKGLTLELEAPAGLPPALADRRLLLLVLLNLVGNAIKFTERGQVQLGLAACEQGHRVEVADTGPGIAPEDQERVFEPFLQLAPGSGRQDSGIGLGLALAREMTRAMGGRLELRSEPGQGSTFAVLLPGDDDDA